MKKNDLDLYHVLLCRVDSTYALLGHNLSASEAEDQLNELHEQRLPVFRG